MDQGETPKPGPCVVVHATQFVAQDLRDILMIRGAQDVLIFNSIDDVPDIPFSIAFADCPVQQLLTSNLHARLKSDAAPVVMVNGGEESCEAAGAGFLVLGQPFRTEDVIALLDRIGLF